MLPKVVTFDCASTLVKVEWTPGGFALDCANAVGLSVGEEERGMYDRALRARWAEYREINETRDPDRCDAFWHDLTEKWLVQIGHPPELGPKMMEAAPELLYGSKSTMFTLYDDVLSTLDALDALNIRVGVISNWDYSLHRVLRALKVYDRFEYVIASLEEGIEKPHPRLFELTLEKFGVSPDEAVHVGDDPLDDLRGAQDFGMRAYLIDRNHQESRGALLARLDDLIHALQSS